MVLWSWAEIVRLSIWPGGSSTSPLWSSAASRSCANEHHLDPRRHMTILGAHWLILPVIRSDRNWPVSASCDTKWPLCSLCDRKLIYGSAMTDTCRFGVSLDGCSLNETWPAEAEAQLPAVRYCTERVRHFRVNYVLPHTHYSTLKHRQNRVYHFKVCDIMLQSCHA